MSIDWKDLERLASDADYDEEFIDVFTSILDNSPLSEKELLKFWTIYQKWKETQSEAGADMWESEAVLEPLVALRILFDQNISDEIFNKVASKVYWYHPGIRSTFFWSLPQRNPSSKMLLALLPLIAKGAPDGISQENYEYLQSCKYFKESMIQSTGLIISESEEEDF
jgi:hypothetical protein